MNKKLMQKISGIILFSLGLFNIILQTIKPIFTEVINYISIILIVLGLIIYIKGYDE